MQEFEPKKKEKFFTKEFISKNIYVLVLAVLLLGGITYGYTFFKENKKVASGSITTASLTINFTDRNISASNLSVPTDNQEGLSEYSKSLIITNTTATDGVVTLNLTRTSGLNLTDMSYAIVVNGAIQEIGDVPSSGKILETAIMGNETINVEVRLWPKTTYSGSETTFVGEITPEIKYLGLIAVNTINNPVGKYVNFNCSGNTCEVWQIVKVEDGRLVLTRQADYTNATSRTNSNKYDTTLTFNDNSLITSVSTDGKNVYLAKTVKITGGDGTIDNPYILENNIYNEEDKKVIAVITYKDGTTIVGTQNVYYNETNYISQVLNDPAFQYWDDGVNHYVLGDTITFTSDTNLTAHKVVNAVNLSFDNTTTGFNCTDAQCALEELYNVIEPQLTAAEYLLANATLETTPYGNIYSGTSPNNYVWFNDEQWQIIGVYGDQVKIIKTTPSDSGQRWNYAPSDGNVWSGSLLQSTYLYDTYWPTLSAEAQGMIDQSATWNIGACGYNIAASDAYTCSQANTWVGKVGLIASYEFLYAAENDGTCWTTSGYVYYDGCSQKDWIHTIISPTGSAWTMSASSSTSRILQITSDSTMGYVANATANLSLSISPVVYLKSSVIITGGNGGIGSTNSYKLG